MAVKKPVVLTDGQLEVLQVGDSLAGQPTFWIITLDFDFGNEGSSLVQNVPWDISVINMFGWSYVPIATSATSLADFGLNGVTFSLENIVFGTSFDVRATALNNASGIYRINLLLNQVS